MGPKSHIQERIIKTKENIKKEYSETNNTWKTKLRGLQIANYLHILTCPS